MKIRRLFPLFIILFLLSAIGLPVKAEAPVQNPSQHSSAALASQRLVVFEAFLLGT